MMARSTATMTLPTRPCSMQSTAGECCLHFFFFWGCSTWPIRSHVFVFLYLSSRAPLSLLNVRHGQPVDVRVARRQDEDYVPPPKAPPKPFEGSGHRLGSPAPFAAPASPSGAAPGAYPSSSSSAAASSEPAVTVDESQPTTQLQIRLGDGSR